MIAPSPRDYISQVKFALRHSAIVQDWTVINEMVLGDRGHFRVRFTLKNGDCLEISEFFSLTPLGLETQRYRYQWMDSTKIQLRKRWDNAPHFPEIETYPNHVHIEEENRVMPSPVLSILDLIMILETSFSNFETS